jgi:hypothetical protein
MRAARDIDAQSLPAIVYTPRTDTTREAEISALRNVYSFVIKSSKAKRNAGGRNGSENDERHERR